MKLSTEVCCNPFVTNLLRPRREFPHKATKWNRLLLRSFGAFCGGTGSSDRKPFASADARSSVREFGYVNPFPAVAAPNLGVVYTHLDEGTLVAAIDFQRT